MTGIIPQDFIDDVLQQTDIVELIDAYIPLKKAGNNFVCCCPFHQEKTPSFNVIPHKQFFYCFGCGLSGNAIKFLMLHLQLSFPESVKQLAQTLGLSLPSDHQKSPSSSHMQDLLLEIQNFYLQQRQKHIPHLMQYLKTRELSASMIDKFQLGYAPDQWHILEQRFPEKKALLLEAGMIIAKDTKNHYDRFRDRLMFPLHNRQGKLIGFAGRVLSAEQKPKYMNSPETALFHKQKELYGLYQVLEHDKNPDFILVVEGYLDVISLFQFNCPYAVATMGTATSSYHLQVLNKYTSTIIFCFDGDAAGQQAAWRALENAIPHYNQLSQVKFLFLPEQHDPDSYIREYGSSAFTALISKAKSLPSYFCDEMQEQYGKQGTQKLIQEIQKYLVKLEEGPGKELIIEEIAAMTRLDPFRVRQWLQTPPKLTPTTTPFQAHQTSPLRFVLALLLQHPELLKQIEKNHIPSILPEPLNLLVETLQISPHLQTATLVERFNQSPFYETFNQLVHFEHHIHTDKLLNTLIENFNYLNKQDLNDQIKHLMLKLKNQGLDEAERKQLQELIQKRHLQNHSTN